MDSMSLRTVDAVRNGKLFALLRGKIVLIMRILGKKDFLSFFPRFYDTLDNLGATGDNGVFAVMNGATLNVTNGLVG